MGNPVRILRFGNLDDIIFAKEMITMLLQEKIIALENELTDAEICVFRDCKNRCEHCSLKELCQKEIDEFYEKTTAITEEKEKIRREIESLEAEITFWERRRFGLPN